MKSTRNYTMDTSLSKIDKMFTSVIKRSRIQLYTEFAKQIQDKKLSHTELYDIITAIFDGNNNKIPQKITPYKLFVRESPDIPRPQLKVIWKNKSIEEKIQWKNRVLAIQNNIGKDKFIYKGTEYLKDTNNMVYDLNGQEIGHYTTEDDIIHWI